ncbi:MAG: Hpt domain-containing protein, partial [bacterium]
MAEEILGKIIKLIENAALCVVMAEDGSDVLSREVLPVFREIAGITENRQEYIFKRINNVSAACIDYITGQQNSVKKDPDAAAAVNSGIAGIQEILNSPEEPVKTVFSEKLNIDDFFECVSDELAVIHSSLVRLSKIGKNSGRHKMEMFFKNLNTIVEKTADKKIPEKDKFETLIGMLVPACEEITGKKAGYETVFNTAKEDENDIPVNKGMIKDFLQKAEPGLDEAERGILIFEKEKDVKTLESFKNVLIFIKEDSAVLGIKETGRAAEEMLAYLKKADSLSADVLLEMRDRLYEMIKSQADKTEPDEKIKESAGSAPRAADEEPLQKNEEFYEFTGDMDLIGDFISEASEHAEIVDKSLLVLEKEKKNPEAINAVFRAFHTLKSLAGFLGLEDTHIMVKETENLLQNIRKETASPDPDVIDVLFASNDMLKKMIQNIKTGVGGSGRIKKAEGVPELVGRIKKLTGGEKKDPELSADSSEKEKEQEAGPADELFRGKEEQAGGGNIPSAAGTRLRETIKVDSEKLDRLIDTIGEIVIAESMIHSASDADESQILEFQKNMGHLNKTTKRLHEFGLSLRLVSLAGVFQKMARFVR